MHDFKDCLFECLNENDSMGIADIEADDCNDTFRISMFDGTAFEIKCSKVDGLCYTLLYHKKNV
jgi:hypothetical protein